MIDIMAGAEFYSGSSFLDASFTINNIVNGTPVAVDLTDCVITCKLKKNLVTGKTFSTVDGSMVIDASTVTIKETILNLAHGQWFGDLTIKFPNDEVWTGVAKFYLNVLEPITNG